jgi:hypothetical protein
MLCCQEYSRTLHPKPVKVNTQTHSHHTQVLAAGTVIPLLSHCKNLGTIPFKVNRFILSIPTLSSMIEQNALIKENVGLTLCQGIVTLSYFSNLFVHTLVYRVL